MESGSLLPLRLPQLAAAGLRPVAKPSPSVVPRDPRAHGLDAHALTSNQGPGLVLHHRGYVQEGAFSARRETTGIPHRFDMVLCHSNELDRSGMGRTLEPLSPDAPGRADQQYPATRKTCSLKSTRGKSTRSTPRLAARSGTSIGTNSLPTKSPTSAYQLHPPEPRAARIGLVGGNLSVVLDEVVRGSSWDPFGQRREADQDRQDQSR